MEPDGVKSVRSQQPARQMVCWAIVPSVIKMMINDHP